MNRNDKFEIIYEDREIIAVYKRSGLLTIATDDGDMNNLYHYVREYVNKKKEKIFIVHRLDKDTSGIVIFAKSIRIKEMLQKCFEDRKVIRKYEAVVKEDIDIGTSFTVRQYLYVDHRTYKTYITFDKKKGKEAITDFTAIKKNKSGTVLDVSLSTGRQNQIRIALKSKGYTLIGDKKYTDSKESRMMLNEYLLEFPQELPLRCHRFEGKKFWL